MNGFRRSNAFLANEQRTSVNPPAMQHPPPKPTVSDEDFLYRFGYADPGMFLELYVPTAYEAEVRRVLEWGADIRVVRKYLEVNLEQIKKLLTINEELTEKYDAARVQDLKPILKGFSIYRGEGAFFEEAKIHSEPVSVVRMMFMAPLEQWIRVKHGVKDKEELSKDQLKELREARFAARRFLRFWTHNKDKYLQHHGECLPPEDVELVDHLTAWLHDIALLVNGYIIHQLCRETMRRFNAGIVPNREVEIWLGSFRSLAVNKVVWNEGSP